MGRFFPHNSDDLREEVSHIKLFLAREFRGIVSKAADPRGQTMIRAANTTGGGTASGSGVGGSGGGGGGTGILGGDIVGSPVNNNVAQLQQITLTLTSPVTGDVLTYNGTAIVNSKTVAGDLTITGVLTASAAGNSLGATALTGDLTLSTHNLVTDGTTGTKLATAGGATGQKLGFFGATPIVQPLLATGAAHTVDDIIAVLQSLGLCRQT